MKRRSWLLGIGSGVTAMACGYRPVYSGAQPTERLALGTASSRVAHAEALHQALVGARIELSRAGVLRSGTARPALIIEVLRIDERSTGVAPRGDVPLARGLAVGVAGRAWVAREGGQIERDTGDLRRAAHVEAGSTAQADELGYRAALRAASRQLGRDLARAVLGEPVPRIEPV